jgi:Domain of unknown function (DUF4055)
MATVDTTDAPNAEGVAYGRMKPALSIVDDVFAGTLRMRDRGTMYMPKFSAEDPDDYQMRLMQAVLYNAFARTIGGQVGMIFRKDPVLSDTVPVEIRGGDEGIGGHWENIDNAGTHGRVFLRDTARMAQRDGIAFIFVDKPPVPEGATSRADTMGLRPYWISIPALSLIRFDHETVAGAPIVTSLAWTEASTVKKGRFSQSTVSRVREYLLEDSKTVRFIVHQKNPDSEQWKQVDKGIMLTPSIPIAPVYSHQTGFFEALPPMLDLALENIGHWQVRSDRRNSLHIAGVPIPFTVGLNQPGQGSQQMKVGISHGFDLPLGGDAKYLEPTGSALSEMREELREIEKRMAALGLAMLERDSRAAETAEARRLDKSEKDSQLAAFASGLQDGAEQALMFHARWLRKETDGGGSITINRDFATIEMDAGKIDAFSRMVSERKLSIETLWARLVQANELPEDFDAETEHERIANETSAELETFTRAVAENGNGNRQPAGAGV